MCFSLEENRFEIMAQFPTPWTAPQYSENLPLLARRNTRQARERVSIGIYNLPTESPSQRPSGNPGHQGGPHCKKSRILPGGRMRQRLLTQDRNPKAIS
jgi:hypothetical protein